MKLLAYTIGGQKIGIDIQTWTEDMLGGNPAFLAIPNTGSTPTDYVEISSTVYWDLFGGLTTLTPAEIKDEILKLIPDQPTAQEFEILEGYVNVGINSMTNIDDKLSFASAALPGALTGVTDDKISNNDPAGELLVNSITGDTGVFYGDYRIEGKLWTETIRRVKQEANIMYVRVDQESGVSGGNNIAGLGILNPTGSTIGYASIDDIPVYYLGIDNSGILVAGWSGNTQPVMLGSSGGITSYSTNNANTVTTTSGTDVLMTGMQLTSIPAGNYLLSFGTSFEHSTNGDQIWTNIYVGGTIVSGSEQHWRRGAAQGDISSTHNYSGFPITLASTATVDIRWRTAGATASAENPYMSLIKV